MLSNDALRRAAWKKFSATLKTELDEGHYWVIQWMGNAFDAAWNARAALAQEAQPSYSGHTENDGTKRDERLQEIADAVATIVDELNDSINGGHEIEGSAFVDPLMTEVHGPLLELIKDQGSTGPGSEGGGGEDALRSSTEESAGRDESRIAPTTDSGKGITKEWCEAAARNEDGTEIAAGTLDAPVPTAKNNSGPGGWGAEDMRSIPLAYPPTGKKAQDDG